MHLVVFYHFGARWWGWRWPGGRCSPPLCWIPWSLYELQEQVDGDFEGCLEVCLYCSMLSINLICLSDIIPHPTSIPQAHLFAASSLCKWCYGLIQRVQTSESATSSLCACVRLTRSHTYFGAHQRSGRASSKNLPIWNIIIKKKKLSFHSIYFGLSL